MFIGGADPLRSEAPDGVGMSGYPGDSLNAGRPERTPGEEGTTNV